MSLPSNAKLSLLALTFALLQCLSLGIRDGHGNVDNFQQSLDRTKSSPEGYLNITAILSSPKPPHHAFIRCLRSPVPFASYPTIGSSLALSSTSNMTLVKLPASPSGAGEGWHNPPHPMWFVLLSGTARVWTPGINNDSVGSDAKGAPVGQEVCVEATGKHRNQIVLALDTKGRGHKTWYYGEENSEVLALQIPLGETWEKQVGEWEIVGEGSC